jgi:hypothetical protein
MADEVVTIKAPNMQRAAFTIRGTSPLVIHAFSQKAREQIRTTQTQGATAKKGKKREPKDFDAAYESAKHVSRDGWCGFAASGVRSAMISACRIVGFQMTKAKISVFVEADGYDNADGTALVRIVKGEPHKVEHMVRNDNGSVDMRARPMWDEGWEAVVRIRWDGDQFTASDVANLLLRAGQQVGICEGRPDSKNSGGMGWGLFTVEGEA